MARPQSSPGGRRDKSERASEERTEELIGLAAGRVKEWVRDLINFTRRNNLLYFKDTKRQHLDLQGASPGEVQRLLGGEEVTLEGLFPTLDVQDEIAKADQRRLREDAQQRIKSIASKAKENFEERSIETLHLAVGECTWDDSYRANSQSSAKNDRVPRAPLLLAPIEIRRGARQGDYKLSIAGDFEINPALRYFMSSEFGIEIGEFSDDEIGVTEAIKQISEHIAQVPGGRASESVQISNFSYAKLAMVEDLETDEADLISNPMIMAICGDQEALKEVRGNLEDPPLDLPNRIEPLNEFLILDADSSQNQVINAILAGQSFAFDGPPGTGKSQTIANAISALVASGKRVLFVAEKRAAIEAVVKRLSDRGIGDLVMDYHGTSKKKKEVLADLRQTYESIRLRESSSTKGTTSALARERDRLVEHSDELHKKREPHGLSIYELMVIAAEHNAGSDVKFRFPARLRKSMTTTDVERCEKLLRRMWDCGGFVDDEALYEWREMAELDPETVEEDIADLGELLDVQYPQVTEVLDSAFETVSAEPANYNNKERVAQHLVQLTNFQRKFGMGLLIEDLSTLVVALEPASRTLGRILATLTEPGFRRAKKRVRELANVQEKPLVLLDITREAIRLRSEWDGFAEFGLQESVVDLRESPEVREIDQALDALRKIRSRFEKFKQLQTRLESDLESVPEAVRGLLKVSNYARTAKSALECDSELHEIGIGRLVDEFRSTTAELPLYVSMLWHSWSRSIIESVGSQMLSFTSTASENLSESAFSFRTLDEKHLVDTPKRIRRIWASNFEESVKDHPDEWNSLYAALVRKRGLPGARTVFGQSKTVITALKPCWVMSPLSVSMLRPPAGWFDIVIFDEASQVLPADAITSIKAARQVVVAGDDKQLPPTTFFASGDVSEDETFEESEDDEIHVGHYESILSLIKYIITKPRQLLWHYRSRDERLIAFSNNFIYKSLITFPDSVEESCLRWVKVEPEDRRSMVSVRATNKAEVDEVVKLVIEHAHNRPEESLGVIALGTPHAVAVEDSVWKAAATDGVLARFIESHSDEQFFVKNLERVQGDERDAVILTIGYGRNERGEIGYNFGPINGRFGERRLNVAVTRAKQRMTLVSTFSHAELDDKKCKSGGLPFLRDYLRYVETDGAEFGDSRFEKPEMNAFEWSIFTRLTAAGYKVVPQYGVGKYRIDFAVVDPYDDSRFILAIECDGASYHSQPTARERDRLRQEALEKRGWVFHRIWSTDWFRDPDHELIRVAEAIESVTQRLFR